MTRPDDGLPTFIVPDDPKMSSRLAGGEQGLDVGALLICERRCFGIQLADALGMLG